MNKEKNNGSVKQLARAGEPLPTVALPTEGSAPLVEVPATDLLRIIDDMISEARMEGWRVPPRKSFTKFQLGFYDGEIFALAKLRDTIRTWPRVAGTCASVAHERPREL